MTLKCQECQERPATLHFTKIINGEKTEFHICEHCAREKGEHFPGSNSFSIHQLLSGLLHYEQPTPQESHSHQAVSQPLACKKCGMSYQQFARIGRFGCADCYKAFQSKLDPMFRRVHSGNVSHEGKVPKRIGGGIQVKRQINDLKATLRQHIDREEFEEAALVRDKIRSLEKKIHGEGE